MELRHTADGLNNTDKFYRLYNKKIIYFENDDYKYLYQTIIHKITGNYHIGLCGLQSKEALIKKFNENSSELDNENNLYIVNKELDIFFPKNCVKHRNFIYLDKYNIDSYFLNKNSIYEFLMNYFKKTYSEIDSMIMYDFWYNNAVNYFKEIYLLYAICISNNKEIKKFEYDSMDDCSIYNKNNLTKYKKEIQSQISNKKFSEHINKYCNIINREYKADFSIIICGKVLFESLGQFINKKRSSFKNKELLSLKSALISSFDLKQLGDISNRIRDFFK